MSALIAARTLGELSGWRQTNLEMQKVLYIAHMLHLGRTGEPLFADRFEAWDFGPVIPSLYRRLRQFGGGIVTSVSAPAIFAFGTSHAFAVDDAFTMTQHMSAGQLVTFAHRPGGAWEKAYRPGERGCAISPNDIIKEWEECVRPSNEAMAWAMQMATDVEASPSRYLDDQDERAFRARLRFDD